MAHFQSVNNTAASHQFWHLISGAMAGKSDAIAAFINLHPHTISANERAIFLKAMRNAIRASPAPDSQVLQKIISLSQYLADWPLLTYLIQQKFYNPTGVDRAAPFIHMGKFAQAKKMNHEALQQQPGNLQLIQQQALLAETMQKHPYLQTIEQDKELWLTPLDYHHVADFGWQYHDPDIASLCNLPIFETAESWLNWLHHCQKNLDQHLFAIIHKEFGFIGSTCLHVHQRHGFFYYWLGADFRGKGFGSRAVAQLLKLGETHFDLQDCFTKIFEHNKASHKATRKIGFRLLPFSAKPPSDNDTFYYRGNEKQNSILHKQLSELLTVLRSEIELDN